MHLASIGIFEGGPLLSEGGALRLAELRQLVSYRLQLVPRLRQKAHAGLWHQAPPTWEDDKSFDIRYHVRECRLPDPGNQAQLLQLVVICLRSRWIDPARCGSSSSSPGSPTIGLPSSKSCTTPWPTGSPRPNWRPSS